MGAYDEDSKKEEKEVGRQVEGGEDCSCSVGGPGREGGGGDAVLVGEDPVPGDGEASEDQEVKGDKESEDCEGSDEN